MMKQIAVVVIVKSKLLGKMRFLLYGSGLSSFMCIPQIHMFMKPKAPTLHTHFIIR